MIVFTSVTHNMSSNKRLSRTILFYLGLTAFCIVFDRVYFLFGHGVESPAMLWMFLYPLLAGVIPLSLLWVWIENARAKPWFRLAYNTFNTALAILIVGSALQGVVDIAGTTSPYTFLYPVAGWILYGISLILFGLGLVLGRKHENV